jgi:hypothetical protein
LFDIPEAEEVPNFLFGRLSADAFDVDGVRHVGCFACVYVIEIELRCFVLLQWKEIYECLDFPWEGGMDRRHCFGLRHRPTSHAGGVELKRCFTILLRFVFTAASEGTKKNQHSTSNEVTNANRNCATASKVGSDEHAF